MSSYDPFRESRQQLDELKRWARRQPQHLFAIVAVVLAVGGAVSSYYQVEPDEVGVVLRFGRYHGKADPGPHFKLPFGVDRVLKVPVQRQLKMEFGFRTVRAGIQSEFTRTQDTRAESQMLTGDRNVASVEWIVQYKIEDPRRFLFNFRDINSTLRLMAEATMRTIVGDHSIDELLTGGREEIERAAKASLAQLNDRYETGIKIQQLKLQDVNAPDPVKPAFREVEEAKQERERAINDAWARYNEIIPRARGRAEQALQEAEGYAVERVNAAKGDAERFTRLYAEYVKAPQVTRTRLYLETLSEVLPSAERKILVDAKTKNLVPLLSLTGGESAGRNKSK